MNRLLLLLGVCLYIQVSANTTPLDFTGTLIDTIAPTITCPPSDTVTLATGQCSATFNYTVAYSDDQPGVILVQALGLASGSAFPAGTTVNLFVAQDAAGNTANCSFQVTVQNPSTMLFCNDLFFVKLDNDCNVTVTATNVLEPGSYGCAIGLITEVDKTAPFGNGPWLVPTMTAADIGKTYQFRVTDPATTNKCWGNGKVIDTIPPVVTCLPVIIPCVVDNYTPGYLKNTLGIAAGIPQGIDNCNGPVTPNYVEQVTDFPCDAASGSFSKIIHRVWTATDASMNTGTCEQVVTVRRSFEDIYFPPDVTINSCNSNLIPDSLIQTPYFQVAGVKYPVEQEASCHFDANYFDTLGVSTCDGNQLVLRTWKVYDLCADQPALYPLTGVQKILIKDDTPPSLVCPANVTVNMAVPDCVTSLDLPDVLITDGCSRIKSFEAFWYFHGLTEFLVGSLADFSGNNHANPDTMGIMGLASFIPSGTTTLLYVATDDCGNTGTCNINIHLWDSIPPGVLCLPQTTVYVNAEGVGVLDAATLDDGSYDECAVLNFKAAVNLPSACQTDSLFASKLYFCCDDVNHTIPVTLRGYDVTSQTDTVNYAFGQGQFQDCQTQVMVLDTFPPACVPPPDVTVTCLDFDPALPYGTVVTQTCKVDSIGISFNWSQFDTACTKGFITKTFKTFQGNVPGQTCSQKITVTNAQGYYVRFPNDVIVTTCSANGLYGEPMILTQGCEKMVYEYVDEIVTVVPDACYKIERTWTIRNSCSYNPALPLTEVPNPAPDATLNVPANLAGPIVSPAGAPAPWSPTVVKITPTDPAATNFSTFWSATANGYTFKQIIKVIDTQDPVLLNCSSGPINNPDYTDNEVLLWNELFWWDNLTGLHDLGESPVDSLEIKATDVCSGNNVNIHYLLFLDLDQDGIQETVINSLTTGAAGLGWNRVPYNNYNTSNYSGGTYRSFDERAVPAIQKYGFALELTTSGSTKIARVRWNTQTAPNTYVPVELPYGTHKITWYVEDGCGNHVECTRDIIITDKKKPIIVCTGPLAVNLPQTQLITLQAPDFLQYTQDNNTPANLLKVAVRKAGTGTGYPLDGSGNPLWTVTYSCADTGQQFIELWSRDLSGNTDSCMQWVQIKDDFGYCDLPLVGEVLGDIKTEQDNAIPNVSIFPVDAGTGLPDAANLLDLTDTLGKFFFNANIQPPILRFLPVKDVEPLNGVSTSDLVALSRHILGIQALATPYRIIAGDANKSGSLTTFDIVEIRKLILGITNDFANNTSWRFVDKNFTFPNPDNPFQTIFPDTFDVSFNTAIYHLIGIKVGDVNNSAQTDSVQQTDDRREPLVLNLPEKVFAAGDLFDVPVIPDDDMTGYQGTLFFQNLDLVDIIPTGPLTQDHFATFPGGLAMAVETGPDRFTLRFRARTNGRLSEFVRLSGARTRAEGYDADLATHPLALRFGTGEVALPKLELYQAAPNPFSDKTQISFFIPTDGPAICSVTDETGRLVYQKEQNYHTGMHSMTIDQAILKHPGVYIYQIKTAAEQAQLRLVKQ